MPFEHTYSRSVGFMDGCLWGGGGTAHMALSAAAAAQHDSHSATAVFRLLALLREQYLHTIHGSLNVFNSMPCSFLPIVYVAALSPALFHHALSTICPSETHTRCMPLWDMRYHVSAREACTPIRHVWKTALSADDVFGCIGRSTVASATRVHHRTITETYPQAGAVNRRATHEQSAQLSQFACGFCRRSVHGSIFRRYKHE